jgi:predicted component of type VI protein secretion system
MRNSKIARSIAMLVLAAVALVGCSTDDPDNGDTATTVADVTTTTVADVTTTTVSG